ncbi:hypothetical protein ACFOVU_06805 [Nocardiopsis sediminis]|uniref:Uncharacterized protein n=1 Tax=Nocardiopsis sediminis TaxID=1778267 RepID=A0ABV8FHM4_9ACTN
MTRALDIAFRIGLGLFLIGGFVLVLAQAAALAAGSGTAVVSAAETIGPAVYATAGITGIIAFIRSYLENWQSGD